jgi:hypothetical protein
MSLRNTWLGSKWHAVMAMLKLDLISFLLYLEERMSLLAYKKLPTGNQPKGS